MRKSLKQLLSINLVLVMLLGMIPVSAVFATTEAAELPEYWIRINGEYYDAKEWPSGDGWRYEYYGHVYGGQLRLNNYNGGSIATNLSEITISGSGTISGESGISAIDAKSLTISTGTLNTSLTIVGGKGEPAIHCDSLYFDVCYHEYSVVSGGAGIPAIESDSINIELSVTGTMKAGNNAESSLAVSEYSGQEYLYLYQDRSRLTFMDGDEIVSIQDVEWENGKTVFECPQIEREGYYLVGWKEGRFNQYINSGFEMYSPDDQVYYAEWRANVPDTILLIDMGWRKVGESYMLYDHYADFHVVVTTNLSLEDPHGFEQGGYCLGGWYRFGDNTKSPVEAFEVGKTYCPIWEANTVTYHLYDGLVYETTTADRVEDYTIPEGALFAGWNTEADGSGIWYSDTNLYNVKETLELYSQHIDNPEEKVLLYTPARSGNFYSPTYQGFVLNTSVVLPKEISYEYTDFWIGSNSNIVYEGGNSYIFGQHDVLAYAQRSSYSDYETIGGVSFPSPKGWRTGAQLIYMSNGGETSVGGAGVYYNYDAVSDSDLILYGASTFSHEEKRFSEWNTKADGSGYSYAAGENVGVGYNFQPDVLYAIWEDTGDTEEEIDIPGKWIRIDGKYYDWDVPKGGTGWVYEEPGYLTLKDYNGGSIATNQERLTIYGSGTITGERGVPAVEGNKIFVNGAYLNQKLNLIGGEGAPAIRGTDITLRANYNEYTLLSGGEDIPAIDSDNLQISELSVTATMKAGTDAESAAEVSAYGGEEYFYLHQASCRKSFLNGDELVSTQDITWDEGLNSVPPAFPEITREGYWLIGWQTSPGDAFDNQSIFFYTGCSPYVGIQEDVTYYAKWEEKEAGSVLLYNTYYEDGVWEYCMEYQQSTDLDATTSHGFEHWDPRGIHRFGGWYLMGDATRTPVKTLEPGNRYCALWERDKIFYQLSNGTVIEKAIGQRAPEDTTIPVGSVFSGWNTKMDGSGDWYVDSVFGVEAAANTVLYSQHVSNVEQKVVLLVEDLRTYYGPKCQGFALNAPVTLPDHLGSHGITHWIGYDSGKVYAAGAAYTFSEHEVLVPSTVQAGENGEWLAVYGYYRLDGEPIGPGISYLSNGGIVDTGVGVYQDYYKVSDSDLILYDADTFTHEEKTFVEWNTRPDGSGLSFKANENVGLGMSFRRNLFYAIWEDSSTGKVIIDGGSYGEEVTWTLYADGELHISGFGEMPDRYYGQKTPWNDYQEDICSVTIDYGVTYIGGSAFEGCGALESIEIPSSVTGIGYKAFEGCGSLESVEIPDSVTSIGFAAFYDCINLVSVILPDGITRIEDSVFYNCGSLASVTIPATVTSLGDYAFRGCNGLTAIEMPAGLKSIGEWAFAHCDGLTAVEIPSAVTSIGEGAFYDSDAISKFVVDGMNTAYCTDEYGVLFTKDMATLVCYPAGNQRIEYSIPNDVTSIADHAFACGENLISVEIPSGVTSIGGAAFSYCKNLTAIEIPDGITEISSSLFYDCRNLALVGIPDSVESIGLYAFWRCSSLRTIKIPPSVMNIGDYAFEWCSKLTSIVFLGDVPTELGEKVFARTSEIYYYPERSGWTTPEWNGYPTRPMVTGIDTTGTDISEGIVAYTLINSEAEDRVVLMAAYDENGKMLKIQQVILKPNGVIKSEWEVPQNCTVKLFMTDGSSVPVMDDRSIELT